MPRPPIPAATGRTRGAAGRTRGAAGPGAARHAADPTAARGSGRSPPARQRHPRRRRSPRATGAGRATEPAAAPAAVTPGRAARRATPEPEPDRGHREEDEAQPLHGVIVAEISASVSNADRGLSGPLELDCPCDQRMAYWTHSSSPRSLAMTSLLSWVGGGALGFVLLATNGCGDARSATTSDSGARDSGTSDRNEPDADAMGGDTPEAGADVDGGGSNSCVSVTGGGPEPWLDLQIVGRQFDAYEGRRIRIVVASQVGWRLGWPMQRSPTVLSH